MTLPRRDSGLVQKLSLAVSAQDGASGQPGDVPLAFELWDYGEPVEIEVRRRRRSSTPPTSVARQGTMGAL